jgi:hypothetical protein
LLLHHEDEAGVSIGRPFRLQAAGYILVHAICYAGGSRSGASRRMLSRILSEENFVILQ